MLFLLTQVQIAELHKELSVANHELAALRKRLAGAGPGAEEENPYLSSDGTYVAASAEAVLQGDVEEVELEAAEEGADDGGSAAEVEVFDEEDEETAAITPKLKRIFKLLLGCTGGGSKELGKPEFDLLGQLVGLEDSKIFRSELLSAAGLAPLSGLSMRNFARAFVSKQLAVPGSSSVPSAVWKAVSAAQMGDLLKDAQKRQLLETELDRWTKALGKHAEGDGEYVEEDDAQEVPTHCDTTPQLPAGRTRDLPQLERGRSAQGRLFDSSHFFATS